MPKQAGGGSIMRGGRGEARGGRSRGVGRGRGRGTLTRSGLYGGEPGKRISPRRGGPVRGGGKRGRRSRSEHVDSVVHTISLLTADKSCNVKTADIKFENIESVANAQETGQKLPGGYKKGKKRVKSNYKEASCIPHPLTIATTEVVPSTPTTALSMPPLRKPESTHRKPCNPSTVFPSEESQDVCVKLNQGFASIPININSPNKQVDQCDPTIKTTKIIKSSRSKFSPNSPSEVCVDIKDKVPPVLPPKDQKLPLNVSKATGLLVLSVTSSYPGYVFTASDRAKLVRCIPGVVIINTAKKGDSLILGVEPEELTKVFLDVEKELKTLNWSVSFEDTTNRDTFSYFGGWKLLPRVDKSGMFQLIVSLRSQGWGSKDAEVKKRNQLLDMVKDFNIAKIVHGEGETILLVGHVLECVAYSDCIRKVFSMERRHTWHSKPISIPSSESPVDGQERHFWVKVKCPELSNLSTAHKQYSVFQQLSTAGKVLQLEHQLFGAVDNYMVVYSELDDTFPVLGQHFCLMEFWPDSLPDIYNPNYGVDAWGFYSVSGKFPDNLSNEIRNKFAEDMKIVGAVGFRSGETEDSFSLHFVNSGCLEQISRCAQYTSFRLTILSSLVRKAHLDKKFRKLVPTILKYKEMKLEKSNYQKIEVMKDSDDSKTVEHVVEKKGTSVDEQKCKFDESQEKKENPNHEAKEGSVKQPIMMKNDTEEISRTKVPAVVNSKQSNDSGPIKKERIAKDKKVNVGKMVGKKEKFKKIFSQNFEVSVDSAAAIDSIAQLSESELFRICWKEEGSIYSYLKNLRKFFDLVADVAVTECEKEVVLNFPSKKKLEDVLMVMSKDLTNSGEKLKLATKVVNLEGSKFYKNKFGLVLVEKNATIPHLKKDFAKFGHVEIEVRSRVFIIWFDTKLGFFRALCDRSIGHSVIPSAQNFKFHKVLNTMERSVDLKVFIDKKTDVPTALDVGEVKSQLTEREIFGFIWQSPNGKIHIRDDQVISRQLTNFIKTVSCKNISADEDGLVVSFSNQEDLSTALSQFSFTIPDKEQLSSMSRKFTLLPSRGFFGLFSAKRVKPDHFSKFGNCKVRNCGIWFSDKLAMFTVLRDPFIKKTYPALFIDCRNIFILSSNKLLSPVHSSEKHVKPAASSALKTKTCQIKLTQFEGVMTRSATARLSSTSVTMEIASPQVSKQYETVPTHKDKSHVVTDKSNSRETAPADPAIVAAVAAPTNTIQPPGPFCLLLSALLPIGKSALGQGKFGQVGKFGHIPTARLVRTGYRQSKMPTGVKYGGEVDLFFKDRDCYRSKDIKEAAKLISNIVQGKTTEVTGATLREIKMKRVEYFLKDQLGVDVVFANKSTPNLDAIQGVPINNQDGVNDDLREYNLDGPTKKASHESSILKNEVEDNDKNVNLPGGAIEVISTKEENWKIPREAGFDFIDLDSLTEEEIKTRKLKIDEERRKFEREALIFPDDFLKDEKFDFPPYIKNIDVEIALIAEEKVTSLGQEIKMNPKVAPQDLTSDLFGLYTLTLSVPRGSDLALLSNLQEDIAWFDTPVSVLCVDMINELGGAMLEVKMMDKSLTIAVLNGLKHKYPGLEGDMTGQHADIVPAKESGLYTLCFTDTNKRRYKGTMEKFKAYSKQLPVISRGLGAEQVLVGFRVKEEAVEAFRQNMDSEEFPELHVASASRS